jgi:hypothetical protein
MRPPGMPPGALGTSGHAPLRLRPGARVGSDTALDNDQSQTLAATHLGLGYPELSIHVSAPIEAPNRTGTGWRKTTDAMDCRDCREEPGHEPLHHEISDLNGDGLQRGLR